LTHGTLINYRWEMGGVISLDMPMRTRSKKHLGRLRIAVLACTTVAAVTALWAVPRLRTPADQNSLEKSAKLRHQETSLPQGWKTLDIKNKVTLIMPPDMQRVELIGDSLRYREAYANRDIHLTIAYADPLDPQSEEKLRRFRMYSCDTPKFLLHRSTYEESVSDIGGRKVKLGIDHNLSLDSTFASACFPSTDDRAFELYLTANCRGDSAVEIAKQIFSSIRFKE